ncbi:MAG: Rrf2 family transcriptional regulator [Oscillospiraceae bacterium]|nr:Rrf2 family transcriptional regulator [Oscillospiraceae bacterium]
MRFQTATDSAIQILQHLHIHDNALQTAMDISSSTGVSYPLFIKIANQLRKHGLLGSVQGRHGGYVLGKAAEEISIYDVFRAIEGDMQLRTCLHKSSACTNGDPKDCGLHAFFRDMQDKLIAQLSSTSVTDLIPAHQRSNIAGGAETGRAAAS